MSDETDIETDGIECLVTTLEMRAPPKLPPLHPPLGKKLALMRAEPPTLAFYRYLYDAVGRDWRWTLRKRVGDARLRAIEKLVHIGNVDLIPDDTVLVRYEVAEGIAIEDVRIEDLPAGWCLDEGASRAIGDNWLDRASSCLLRVPS